VAHTLRRHLDDPPSGAELRASLGLEPWDTTRDGQARSAQA
jgi:hypothetical protein